MSRPAATFLASLLLAIAVAGCGDDNGGVTEPENSAPEADAGLDQTVAIRSQVTLDGSGSHDPDEGDDLTCSWSLVSRPAQSQATIAGPLQMTTCFVADHAGVYVACLTVSDGEETDTDCVTITVEGEAPNQRPVADAGSDQTVDEGSLVTLDGSASFDPNVGDTLSFAWALIARPSGSQATIEDADAMIATMMPDFPGTYVAELTVSDGEYEDSDAVTITAEALGPNQSPVADAGADQIVEAGSMVSLNGSGSYDPDPGDILTYSWELIEVPVGSGAAITNPDMVICSFVPDLAGVYVARLTVTDGIDSDSDEVTVTVEESGYPQTWDFSILSDFTLRDLADDPGAVDYIVPVDIWIDALLTIEPGVRIQCAAGIRINVESSAGILALGTEGEPIVFEGQVAEAGHWDGLWFSGDDTLSEMTYVEVAHGNPNVTVWGDSGLKLTHSTLRMSAVEALSVHGGLPEFAENRFEENIGPPVKIPLDLIELLDPASEYNPEGSENGKPYIDVFDLDREIETPRTWPALGVPYRMAGAVIALDVVTIEPGADFIFAGEDAGFAVMEGGAINAVGTPTEMITFRGEEETPGSWETIMIWTDHPMNEMTYAIVAHGNPNITLWGGSLKLTHSILRMSGSEGLMATDDSQLPEFAENRFEQNAGAPIRTGAELLGSLDAGSSYNPAGLENGKAYIDIPDSWASTPQTWLRLDVPYRVAEWCGVATSLTIEAGTRLLFASDSQFHVSEDGALTAVGTPVAMISFLGEEEVAGFWRGLSFGSGDIRSTGVNILDYVEIGYCGADPTKSGVNVHFNTTGTITNSYIHDSSDCGVAIHVDADWTLDSITYANIAGDDVCWRE